MSEEPLAPPPAAPPSPSMPSHPPPVVNGRRQAANFCAAGLTVCFFLPWLRIFFVKLSGFDYQRLSDEGKSFWLMPILCVATLVAGFTGRSQKVVGQLAGLTPFAILVYGLIKLGSDLIKALEPGGWLALVLGAALFILTRR